MGLDFSKVTPPASPTGEAGTEIETVKPYDIVADRKQMNETLVNSDEVDALVSTIEGNDCLFWSRCCRGGGEGIGYCSEQHEHEPAG